MLAVEIAQYLAAQGAGSFTPSGTSGNIFINNLPETTGEAIGIYPSGGLAGDGTDNYYPTVQILVRGTTSGASAWATAMKIFDALQYFRSQPLVTGGEHIVICNAAQAAPTAVGRDEKRRVLYSLNFQFMIPHVAQ